MQYSFTLDTNEQSAIENMLRTLSNEMKKMAIENVHENRKGQEGPEGSLKPFSNYLMHSVKVK
jgi:hypothetical protein